MLEQQQEHNAEPVPVDEGAAAPIVKMYKPIPKGAAKKLATKLTTGGSRVLEMATLLAEAKSAEFANFVPAAMITKFSDMKDKFQTEMRTCQAYIENGTSDSKEDLMAFVKEFCTFHDVLIDGINKITGYLEDAKENLKPKPAQAASEDAKDNLKPKPAPAASS